MLNQAVVWPQLCGSPTPGAMVPLDSAAQTLMSNTPIYPAGSYGSTVFGAGLDAGA